MTDETSLCIQQLKALGLARGYLTHEDVNRLLPRALVDPVEIEQIIQLLLRAGIRFVDRLDRSGNDGGE